ncbi:MAG: hypothetical protein R3E10_18435 [Gemmatimonadota bacterium]
MTRWLLVGSSLVGAVMVVAATSAAQRPDGVAAVSGRPAGAADNGASDAALLPAPLFDDPEIFKTSDRCLACHKGVSTTEGVDVSIGYDWRASMMANSGRDPYWQAAVRREITDYPEAQEAIEAKCSRCHMPMANEVATRAGRSPGVFENLPIGGSDSPTAVLAADGVSCSACHQIVPDGLGTDASFTGGFRITEATPAEGRPMYGPFEPDAGGVGIMHSATGFRPTEGRHIQSSELCASCHTLFTHAVQGGQVTGPEFPEQAPYLEWKVSRYAEDGQSCQDCHMPEVGQDVPVTAVLGRARPNVSRHVFRGGNFFMLRMLGRYRAELGVTALPQELALSADRTEAHLRTSTVEVAVENAMVLGQQLHADVRIHNLAGHKFPTAYPSRRAWIHLTVRDRGGSLAFESGAFQADGRIDGNDNDADPARYEPHYTQITTPEQVQIYEAVMADGSGAVTTGLMSAERWLKDNRLQPEGFDAAAGGSRVATRGAAVEDADFGAGGDRVRYTLDVDPARGPFTVEAELWFQPVAYRWAMNLADYETFETQRFVRYYRDMASRSALVVGQASAQAR